MLQWIDICCIDKLSLVEFLEVFNFMFWWYCEVQVCYVYLSDVNYDDDYCVKESGFGFF